MPQALVRCRGAVHDGILVVTVLTNELREAQSAYDLRDEIKSLVDEKRSSDVVIDCGQIQLIGSIGFLAFLSVRRHLRQGRVILCGLSDPVREMFAVCRLIPTEANQAGAFEVASTREAALRLLLA